MKSEGATAAADSAPPEAKVSNGCISKNLLMAPKATGFPSVTPKHHRRAGSTGTTGDESCTTDEEDNGEPDEPDCTIKDHVTGSLFNGSGDFSSFSDKAMHRNSSDSSVYSDLGLDKCAAEFEFNGLDGSKRLEDADDSGANERVDWVRSVVGAKEQALSRLQNELKETHLVLKLRDEEVARLTRIRQDVETELEDLTASLFQEAHNMVREANEKQASAERALKESQMKVDVLTAEVAALKTLVLTSTPSRPNPHLHPQIDLRGREESGGVVFTKKHQRSPSHFNLKYGRENSPPESPVKEASPIACVMSTDLQFKGEQEVDPNVHQEFLAWKENPSLDKSLPFIKRVYTEDIDLCLRFNNAKLSEKVRTAVESGSIFIESVGDKSKAMFPKKCALLEVPRPCFYRMNTGEPDTWYSISQICRNRITAVCDFLNYLKYIERGLVKSSAHDVYWEIARLRKDMVLARLGLSS